jgi:hypothetical protein
MSLPAQTRRRAAGAGALAGIVGIGAAYAVRLVRARRAPATTGQPILIEPPAGTEVPAPAVPAHAAEEPVSTFTCECGEELRVRVLDRHRVYWAADAPDGEPLIEHRCPACDRPLPSGHSA